MRGLCTKPYHNHKKGLVNFNKKEGCPPNVGFLIRCMNVFFKKYMKIKIFFYF
jgi:hypothetical protein